MVRAIPSYAALSNELAQKSTIIYARPFTEYNDGLLVQGAKQSGGFL